MAHLTAEEKETIEQLFKDGFSIKDIVGEVKKSDQTIRNHLDRVGLKPIQHPVRRTTETVSKTQKEAADFDARRCPPATNNTTHFVPIRKPDFVPSEGIRRGQIYFITKYPVVGNEFEPGRPGVIVSHNRINVCAETVEIVFLTTKEQKDSPTHVDVRSSGTKATAVCEQVQTVSKLRLREYCGVCSDTEMAMIDTAIAISLGLDFDKEIVQSEAKSEPIVTETESTDFKEVAIIITERDTYKRLYEELLDKLVRR